MNQNELKKIIEKYKKNGSTELDLSSNHLTEIPPEIGKLKNLTKLDLSSNQLTEIPKEIGELKNLTKLNLTLNNLTEIPKEIGELKNLTELYLFNNHLTKIPSEIGELKNLTELYLDGTKLTEISPVIGKLKNLTVLDLSSNHLTEIPPVIGKLKNLTELKLYDNKLSEIPPEIGKLKNLTKLDLSSNQLTEIPKEIGELKNLTGLDLSSNQLTEIPKEIGELKNLTGLDLAYNQFTEIPKEIGELKNLTELELSKNQLTKIPKEIGELKSVMLLNISYNPLTDPPIEVVSQGIKAIRNYFEEKVEGIDYCFEAKLLIVGQGDVGKTCLRKRILKNKYNPKENRTKGVDTDKWIIKTDKTDEFTINFWDFGGQEILHSTHQFFLTKRSLYLFVWEARPDDDISSFDYWLNIIKILGDESPVIVVMNKSDELIKSIPENQLKKSFKNIISFHQVSAATGEGVDRLKKEIIEEIQKLPHIGDELPKVWKDIRNYLRELNKNYILYQEYIDICKELGLDKKRATFLSQYLHDLGVFLHFRDTAFLQEILFLKPEWATNAVYKIIETKEVQNNFGRFNHTQLTEILEDYPADKYIYLVKLMEKFELCYSINDNEYFVPELFKADMPKFDWDYNDNLIFGYQYEFMPAGILTRFIVRNNKYIKDDLSCKYGVVIHIKETEAFIDCSKIKRSIIIRIKGNEKNKLLYHIRNEFYEINETINFPKLKEVVYCNCRVCKESKTPEYFSYEKLLKYLSKGEDKILCENLDEFVKISDLIGEIEPKTKDELYEMVSYIYEKFISEDISETDKKNIFERLIDPLEIKPSFFGISYDFSKLSKKKIKDKIKDIKDGKEADKILEELKDKKQRSNI